jgi:hypothetical protein
MIAICAWCGIVLGEYDIAGKDDIITHGICTDCEEKVHAALAALRRERAAEQAELAEVAS